MSDAPVIRFSGTTLALGSRAVLSDVDLAIPDGCFVGVLGPNGAGKTTFFRAVLGLLPPRTGSIRVFGERPARGDSRVGYMPQTRAMSEAALRLRGRDLVAAAVDGHRWGPFLPGPTIWREVDRALDVVGATVLAQWPLGELSGGERQRVLLAQALLGNPRLLLLDEPLANLDPRYQQGVVELVRNVQRALGITVLFSAHETNPLLGALDRVLYLGGGRAALGTVDEVITGPVLSKLYGTPIDVVRVDGRIFVMSGGQDVERGHHHHPHALVRPCLTTTSCARRSPPRPRLRWYPAASAIFWCCAGKALPDTRWRMWVSRVPPGRYFSGATPLAGMVALTVAAGVLMGFLGERLDERDVAIGMILALALGFGLLFLHFFTAYATQATALLFGNVLAVDEATLWTLVALCVVCVAALATIARPLLFASLQPELAEAAGVPLRLVSVLFLAIVALAVAQCAQIVGVLLVFTLMVGPAATAQRVTSQLGPGLALAAVLALGEAWGGLALAYWTDWPVSFWITALSGIAYAAAQAAQVPSTSIVARAGANRACRRPEQPTR